METVLIVIHLMVVLALVGVVLLQRSEGGGLGIGGGSGFMTARGAANALTRATAILAAAFFVTSLTLSIVARYGEKPIDILDRVPATSDGAGKGVLDQLPGTTRPAPAGNAAPTPPSGNDAATTPAPTAPATAPAAGATAPATNGTAPAAPATPQVPNQ
ncbi:preprotein translocase subunit SecG [Mesorhizobium sp.]|jgi:preprotein translocase subunit SecG|uniref:preprotein translocase subunit SecG n=1 Tax=Mesorhizobium sp. TaxID=1871066 RepID=UPI0035676F74